MWLSALPLPISRFLSARFWEERKSHKLGNKRLVTTGTGPSPCGHYLLLRCPFISPPSLWLGPFVLFTFADGDQENRKNQRGEKPSSRWLSSRLSHLLLMLLTLPMEPSEPLASMARSFEFRPSSVPIRSIVPRPISLLKYIYIYTYIYPYICIGDSYIYEYRISCISFKFKYQKSFQPNCGN